MKSESAVSEYEIQYAKFRKMGGKRVKKKMKNLKKKKKKKHKKRKKYESSSDSESSSSSSSSSDTDSESESTSSDDESSDNGETYDGDEKEREEIRMAVVDEKQLKFKSVVFKNTDKILKKNCYKLKKLSRGYCYIIKIRSKNELGWSDWSDYVKVITSNDNKWQFQENNWKWNDFDDSTTRRIDNAYNKGKKKCRFDIAHIGQSYVINFKLMEQTNVKTRKVRKVRIVDK